MELVDFKNFDYIVLAIIFFSAYLGWRKGFIESFIDFFAWIGSALIVADNYQLVFGLVNNYVPSAFISGFIASFCFYILLVITISFIGVKAMKLTSKFCGGTVDKLIGAVFGVLRGVLVVLTMFWSCYMALYAYDQELPEWFIKAKGYKILKISSDSLFSIVASEEERIKLLNMIEKKTNKLEEEVKSNMQKKKKETSEYIDVTDEFTHPE